MPRGLVRRLLLAVVLAIGCGVGVISSASAAPLPAAPWDCKTAPSPSIPDTGLPGFLDPAPNPVPPKGDPFGPKPTSTIYDQYGYAGLTWNTYDLGCMGGVGEMDASVDTFAGNAFLSAGTWITSATNGIHNRVAHPEQYMAPLDDIVATVTKHLHDAIWSPWGMVSLLGVGALLLYYSMRGRLSAVASGAAWAVLVLAVLSGVSQYPTRVASFFDETVTQTIASVNQTSAGLATTAGSDPTRAQGSLIVDDILYQAWLRGEFGDPDSQAARTWGPLLFRESTFSRAELEQAQSRPNGVREMTEQKANDWVATTQEIQDKDPLAYAQVQGKAKGRAGAGLMAFIGVLLTGVFRLIADIFVFAGLVMLRLVVMFFPAAAVFGIIAPMSAIVRRIGNIAGASTVNVIAFGAGSAIHTVVISAILSRANGAGMGILSLVLCLVVSLAAFVLLMPLLSFTNILGHSNRGASMLQTARRSALGYLVGRKAVGDGSRDAEDGDQLPTVGTGETSQQPSDVGPTRSVRRVNLPAEAFGRPATAQATHPEVPQSARYLDAGPTGRALQLGAEPAPLPQSQSQSQPPAPPRPATFTAATTHRSTPSGIRLAPVYDPGPGTRARPVLSGTIVSEVPPGVSELRVTRHHDSHAEVTTDGVRTRFFDPTAKEFVSSGDEQSGVRAS